MPMLTCLWDSDGVESSHEYYATLAEQLCTERCLRTRFAKQYLLAQRCTGPSDIHVVGTAGGTSSLQSASLAILFTQPGGAAHGHTGSASCNTERGSASCTTAFPRKIGDTVSTHQTLQDLERRSAGSQLILVVVVIHKQHLCALLVGQAIARRAGCHHRLLEFCRLARL